MPAQQLSFARVYRRQPTSRATMTKKKLLILDDLMRESSSNVILDLFTKGSHHKNISVIFITQNVFHKGKAQRDISLNTKYLMLYIYRYIDVLQQIVYAYNYTLHSGTRMRPLRHLQCRTSSGKLVLTRTRQLSSMQRVDTW